MLRNNCESATATASQQGFFVQVVPFSPASGLLEWVEDTIPVHEYLTGKDKQSGAQKRYSKSGNLSFSQCFQAMHKAKRNQLRQTFDHVSHSLHSHSSL